MSGKHLDLEMQNSLLKPGKEVGPLKHNSSIITKHNQKSNDNTTLPQIRKKTTVSFS